MITEQQKTLTEFVRGMYTMAQISERTGINKTRVFRITSAYGSIMRIDEYFKFFQLFKRGVGLSIHDFHYFLGGPEDEVH